MINPITLACKIRPYRVTKDEDMPAAYRRDKRYLHDDWLPGVRWVPRMWTAFRVPFPFKKIAGNQEPIWVPYQEGYPLVPGTEVRKIPWYNGRETVVAPHIAVYEHIPKTGEWSRQSAFLDGKWVECYYASTFNLFGKIMTTYRGLKPDTTLGDWMAWYPEAGLDLDK